MRAIATTLLILVLVLVSGATLALAQTASDDPAASPRTVERIHILGVPATTAIVVAAAILFVIVLAAAALAREPRSYTRSNIDPRQ